MTSTMAFFPKKIYEYSFDLLSVSQLRQWKPFRLSFTICTLSTRFNCFFLTCVTCLQMTQFYSQRPRELIRSLRIWLKKILTFEFHVLDSCFLDSKIIFKFVNEKWTQRYLELIIVFSVSTHTHTYIRYMYVFKCWFSRWEYSPYLENYYVTIFCIFT